MPSSAILLLYSLISVVHYADGNELIVETFENLDFGFNSHSIRQLIAALIVIGVISLLLAATVLIFRIYLYCRNDANTRQYQLPLYDDNHLTANGNADGYGHNKASRNSFQSIFVHTVENV